MSEKEAKDDHVERGAHQPHWVRLPGFIADEESDSATSLNESPRLSVSGLAAVVSGVQQRSIAGLFSPAGARGKPKYKKPF